MTWFSNWCGWTCVCVSAFQHGCCYFIQLINLQATRLFCQHPVSPYREGLPNLRDLPHLVLSFDLLKYSVETWWKVYIGLSICASANMPSTQMVRGHCDLVVRIPPPHCELGWTIAKQCAVLKNMLTCLRPGIMILDVQPCSGKWWRTRKNKQLKDCQPPHISWT